MSRTGGRGSAGAGGGGAGVGAAGFTAACGCGTKGLTAIAGRLAAASSVASGELAVAAADVDGQARVGRQFGEAGGEFGRIVRPETGVVVAALVEPVRRRRLGVTNVCTAGMIRTYRGFHSGFKMKRIEEKVRP